MKVPHLVLALLLLIPVQAQAADHFGFKSSNTKAFLQTLGKTACYSGLTVGFTVLAIRDLRSALDAATFQKDYSGKRGEQALKVIRFGGETYLAIKCGFAALRHMSALTDYLNI